LFAYGTLVWATGSQPRQLEVPGAQQCTIRQVRAMRDIVQLRSALGESRRVVVAGAGFIGLEVAPGLRKLGKEVALVDPAFRVLEQRVAPVVSAHVEALHRGHGVDLRLGAQIRQIQSAGGQVKAVQLASGEDIPCDLLIAAVGTQPVVEPLAAAGASITNGLKVDAFCRTSLPDVFAVGDCAAQEHAFARGACIRLESIQHATDQAKCVARVVTGSAEPYAALPWFWSNQFDMRLQTVGLSMGHDRVVVRGSPETGKFSVAYLRQGRLAAIDCINSPRDFLQAKPLILAGAELPEAALADADMPLSALSAMATRS
jgi:3-phenylpropionate/trans-cinnamate dioxygenase ferredoxin reductase subunit